MDRPAAECSSAGLGVVSQLIKGSADVADAQADVHPVAELLPFPQAQPDTFTAFLKKKIHLLLFPFPPNTPHHPRL